MSGQGPSSGNFVASELNYLVVNYLEQCTSVDRVVLSQLKRSLESQRYVKVTTTVEPTCNSRLQRVRNAALFAVRRR